MSIGNLKDTGNQGNNLPWQWRMLKGIQAIVDALSGTTVGLSRTTGILRPSNTTGNVNTAATTFFSVSVANVGAANGTVLGTTIKPGEVLNFSADALNNYFTTFAYNATGTEFIIIYVA